MEKLNPKTVRDRIVPVPQKIVFAGEGFEWKEGTKFALRAPQGGKAPVPVAVELLKKHIETVFGKDALAADGIPVTLALGEAPAEVKAPEEGYSLKLSAEGAAVTGFSGRGLLHGVVSLIQLLSPKDRRLLPLEILDWPDNPLRGIKI